VAESFYVPAGEDRWLATSHTAGPWSPDAQHGGPPSALLGRAMRRCQPREDMIFARFSCEILGAIPVGELSVTARVARPGRSVELLEATASAGGREVARAAAWRIRRTTANPVPPRQPAPPELADARPMAPPAEWSDGYLSAVEWRPVRGSFAVPGPAAVWARARYPLVPDEEPTGFERVLTIADSGNGVSWELDLRRWMFINPELTVHLHREPVGEWICLDAQTRIAAGGIGIAESVLYDARGRVGRATQALLVAPR
jgi:hypothetical protein